MKRNFLLLFLCSASTVLVFGQQSPTNTAPFNGGSNNARFWSRSGNYGNQNTGSNLLGTRWNSPIYFMTDANNNATNGVNTNNIRFTILGTTTNTPTNASSSGSANGYIGVNTQNPYSRFHIAFPTTGGATITPSGGWRNFMREGLLLQKENDLFWFGLNPVPGFPGAYNSEIVWADDPLGAGPDDMVFRFSTSTSNANAPTLQVARFTGSGNQGYIGFGNEGTYNNGATSRPTHRIDVDGNARFRCVPDQVGANCDGQFPDNSSEYLILGNELSNPDDIELRKLAFTGNTDDVLLGDGTWGPVAPNLTANNGISINANSDIQLGVPCNVNGAINLAAILANRLTQDRVIYAQNQHLWFATTNNNTGGFGFGGQFTGSPFCTTGNTVEISANNNNTQYGNTSASGLRFTKLIATSPTVPDGINGVDASKVLTVDGDGDVVLTDAASGLACWDLNGDGIQDASEDINGDQQWNALDCQGPAGNDGIDGVDGVDGMDGAQGPIGPAGPAGSTVTADNGLNHTNSGTNTNIQLGGNLLQNTAVALDNNYLHFSGQGRIGIGSLSNSKLTVRNDAGDNFVHVLDAVNSNGNGFFKFQNNGKFRTHAFLEGEQAYFLQNELVGTGSSTYYGADIKTTSSENTGQYVSTRILMTASSTKDVKGLWAFSRSPLNDGMSTHVGVQGNADRTTTGNNIGVSGYAGGGANSYGVYGARFGANSWAGFFVGNISINGVTVTTSDRKLKKNISNLSGATEILDQLQPKTYEFKTEKYTSMGLDEGNQFGLIAQELEKVLPELVKNVHNPEQTDENGEVIIEAVDFKGVNYQALIPILIQGHKEQQEVIDEKDEEIDALKERLDKLEQLVNSMADNSNENLNTRLSDVNYVVLEQNVPNPFAEKTTINFHIPEEVAKAQIIFYNEEGKLINTVNISDRGAGSLNVFTSDLSSGIYTYSLIVDGEIFETKKMVKK